jgi:hypothetical protein
MSCTRGDVAISGRSGSRLLIVLTLLALATFLAVAAAPVQGSMGYEPATPNPVLVSGIEWPHGVAVDQANHRVYVAVVSDDALHQAPGAIRRFESDGQAAGTFLGGPEAFFSGVAVNPVTQGFYGSQVQVKTPLGTFGTAQMDPFSSSGTLGTPFPLSFNDTLPQIATDSGGNVYFPNAATDSVQVFDSTGALQETIGCGGCPGGAFGRPASVALDSDGDLYVVDLAPDRVLKLAASGGSYVFDSVLQSGRGAAAVGVDPSTDDVFVGDLPKGKDYHVVAYDSSGAPFDDFGAGLFIDPPVGVAAAAQIAADATTHKLYLSETDKIYVFERVTISPPSATTTPPSPVGQLTATLNATVNANGHAALVCEFEYTDEADAGFTNPTGLPCPELPDGSGNTALGVSVSGLSPNTGYRYRVIAANNAGPVTSGSRTFKTLPVVLPTVTAESPLAVTQVGATIKGRVNPHGGTASDCHFEFGTSLSYGSSIPCTTLPGPVTTDVAEGRTVSELAPGTAYHYRLVVTTNAGTTEGADVEFRTASPPAQTPEPQPSTLPPPTAPPPPIAAPTAPTRPLHCRKGFRKKRVHGKVRCVRKQPVRRRRSRR